MEISNSLVPATHARGEWGSLNPDSGRGSNAREWGRSLTQVPCSWSIWSWRATRKQWSGSGPGQRRRVRRKPPRYRRARNLDVHPWSWMRFKHPPKTRERQSAAVGVPLLAGYCSVAKPLGKRMHNSSANCFPVRAKARSEETKGTLISSCANTK